MKVFHAFQLSELQSARKILTSLRSTVTSLCIYNLQCAAALSQEREKKNNLQREEKEEKKHAVGFHCSRRHVPKGTTLEIKSWRREIGSRVVQVQLVIC